MQDRNLNQQVETIDYRSIGIKENRHIQRKGDKKGV